MNNKVFVAAGMSLPKSDIITDNARRLGRFLAENGFTYVQGGSADGLMGVTLKEFICYSKNVQFLIPKAYYNNDAQKLMEIVGKDNFNAKLMRGEADRLTNILSCKNVIVLPGGTGTIEELLYLNETSRAKEHACHIILVNCDNFYAGLSRQIETCYKQGLTKREAIKFQVINDVSELKNIW